MNQPPCQQPLPHHPDALPALLLPRGLDPETVQVLAGVARKLTERRERCALDGGPRLSEPAVVGGYLSALAGVADVGRCQSHAAAYDCLLEIAAVAVEQADLHARAAEISADPMRGIAAGRGAL